MGMIERVLTLMFGGGANLLRDTAEVFHENAEAGAARDHARAEAALSQFSAEFGQCRSRFDVLIDGINRLPRPLLALGTIGLIVAAMIDPIWFAERMQGLALVPEALWWLMGAVVSFYFGARHQLKNQQFQRDVTANMARVPQVVANIDALRDLRADSPGVAAAPLAVASMAVDANPALEEWRRQRAVA
ncbi:holin family protein [Pseudooceanicola sp.]|uniref:holin family protein n=1 Tax=Pseudooceanicola sp. TaxID=1914328 RepID=UPI00262EB6A8|nr:holin family protein [Pseudooceanicola sp.]MDF1855454.1 holin family protein [Pseudooceanicola sp.]